MNLKERTFFLGIGCCGGKEAKEFIDMGYQGTAINGSEQDLKALGNIPKYHLQGFDGFGGHREKAIDCLAANKDFMSFIRNIKEEIVFVLFGGGGSTGSGCGTIVAEMLLDEGYSSGNHSRIVCPVISLPSCDEAINKHSNAYQAVQELQDIDGLGATFFINNDVSDSYSFINSTFAKLLDTFLSNDTYSERNNFDEAERLEMLRNSGAMVYSFSTKEQNPEMMLDKLTKNGIFAPIENNKICENIAIIHADNNEKDIEKSVVISEVGKPHNVFEGYNNKKGTLIAVSGLDYPVTHVSKLGELAKSAFEERQRNKKLSAQKLDNLSFFDDDPKKTMVEKKKKTSRFELLMKMSGNNQ